MHYHATDGGPRCNGRSRTEGEVVAHGQCVPAQQMRLRYDVPPELLCGSRDFSADFSH